MTPADLSALVAPLAILAAAATAGPWHREFDGGTINVFAGDQEFDLEVEADGIGVYGAKWRADAVFIVALVNAWPSLAAAIRDLTAQVEEDTVERYALAVRCDALAARLDAAEKVCREAARSYYVTEETRIALDAWRALSPSGGGHDTDTGGGG